MSSHHYVQCSPRFSRNLIWSVAIGYFKIIAIRNYKFYEIME